MCRAQVTYGSGVGEGLKYLESEVAMNDTSDCRAFLVHWKDAHRRLHEVVRGLRTTLQELASSSPEGLDPSATGPLKLRLTEVRDELSRHFAEEEAGACIEEAISRLPGLSPEAREVERQHPELLARVDRLLQLVEHGRLQEVGRAFAEFDQELRLHELRENRIIEHGFNTILENGPVPGTAV